MRMIDVAPLIANGWVLEKHGVSNVIIGRMSLADVPTIEPDTLRPTGRWEPRTDVVGFVCCSVCHDCNVYADWPDGKKWNYCPNCGAMMEV